jgi:hypothetical protein
LPLIEALHTPPMRFSFYSFQLHDNALALHEYTRHERKMAASGNGVRFDGELDTFQEPELSSLGRLVRLHCSSVLSLLIVVSIEYGRYPAAMIGYAPSDSLMIGTYNTGICPLWAPSANAKSTVPRFFSLEHRFHYCQNNTYSYFASSR